MDLSSPLVRIKLAQDLKAHINDACISKLGSDRPGPNRLGPSDAAAQCLRASWYKFHWYAKEVHSGARLRLFEEGNRHEAWMLDWLRWVGFTIVGTQVDVTFDNPHIKGKLDAIAEIKGLQFIVSLKTSGTGKAFNSIMDEGVKTVHPAHWIQECMYGWRKEIKHGLWLYYNKNDSDIAVEFNELEWDLGESQYKMLSNMIDSPVPPPKISEQGTHWICRMCPYVKVCHLEGEAEKNCRSCTNGAVNHRSNNWFCNLYQDNIPTEVVKTGCDAWKQGV